MATRVGIELSPDACRIVEIDAGPTWRRHKGETRVRAFAVLPPSGPQTQAKLQSLRKRHVAVVVWDGPSDHRQVMVTNGSYESMRAEALGALAAAGLETRGVWADIAPASGRRDRATRRPVVVALASGSALASALQPLVDAGIRPRTVTTPAMALGSLARLRRTFSMPDAIEVYVALETEVTCITLVRGGVLVAARPLAWGYADDLDVLRQPRERDDITTHLADAIREFVAGIGGSSGDIGQVCICGGLPELRTMTLPLMERLDVEVEPLDSLFGIDTAQLPESAEGFRERGAELRLAWAVAADWPAPINLLRAPKRRASKTMLARAVVAAGVAAGMVVGWRVEQSQWWRSTAQKPVTGTAVNLRPRGGLSAPTPTPTMASPVTMNKRPDVTAPPVAVNERPLATAPPTALNKPPVVTAPPPLAVNRPPAVSAPPPVALNMPLAVTAPPPVALNMPPVVTAPPAALNKPPVVTVPAVAVNRPPAATTPPTVVNSAPVVVNKPPVAPPPRQESPAPVSKLPPPVQSVPVARPPALTRVVPRPALAPVPARAPALAPTRARPTAPPEVALPFDAVLGTILYSPGRKLAIVDGRVVGPGDEVRGARVVDITPNEVMFRDAQGRLRRLALGSGSR